MQPDRLSFDVRSKMSQVDAFFNKLLVDKSLQSRFFKNPHGILADFGISSKAPRGVVSLANRISYAALSNSELISFIGNNAPRLKVPSRLHKKLKQSLAQGRIEFDPTIERMMLRAYLKSERHLKKLFLLLLTDLNKKKLLPARLTSRQIRSTVLQMLARYKGKGLAQPVHLGEYSGGESLLINVVPFPSGSHTGSGGTTCVGFTINVVPFPSSSHSGGGRSNSVVLCSVFVVAIVLVATEFLVWGESFDALTSPEGLDASVSSALDGSEEARKTLITIARTLSLASDLALFVRSIDEGVAAS